MQSTDSVPIVQDVKSHEIIYGQSQIACIVSYNVSFRSFRLRQQKKLFILFLLSQQQRKLHDFCLNRINREHHAVKHTQFRRVAKNELPVDEKMVCDKMPCKISSSVNIFLEFKRKPTTSEKRPFEKFFGCNSNISRSVKT